jgi:hypothetical protein
MKHYQDSGLIAYTFYLPFFVFTYKVIDSLRGGFFVQSKKTFTLSNFLIIINLL